MLRLAVLLLVLANTAYFAWSHGLLAGLGLAPLQQTEPERLQRQVRPEVLRIVPDAGASAAPALALASASAAATTEPSTAALKVAAPDVVAAAATPGECLQAGIFNETQTALLRSALEGVPPDSWVLESSVQPARWMVYLGKITDPAVLDTRRGELRERGIGFETIRTTALAPGLSLGRFGTQAQAEQELARISGRGVRNARVVQERPETRGVLLKLPAADAALRARITALKLPMDGKSLTPCRA